MSVDTLPKASGVITKSIETQARQDYHNTKKLLESEFGLISLGLALVCRCSSSPRMAIPIDMHTLQPSAVHCNLEEFDKCWRCIICLHADTIHDFRPSCWEIRLA
jgi:hypothetical protein